MSYPSYKGFTLIELMIVVGLIGILAVMAIPSYQHYIKRARFSEVIAVTQIFKTAIALALQEGANLADLKPGVYGIPDLPKPTKNLADLKIENGIITATATALLTGATYILKPNVDGTVWNMTGTCIKLGLCHV